ncbi:hypothetical protein AAE478_002125 [Parahypoxylon ruwenzoriense]
MADSNANGIEKGANGEVTAPESQPTPPPATKEPTSAASAGEEPAEPSIATKPATDDVATVPSAEPAAQNDDTAASSKEELTQKMDEADKLASQPEEKPAGSAPTEVSQSTTTEAATATAPSLPNGEAKEPPKPVTVEVHDQDLPAAPPTQPIEKADVTTPAHEPASDTLKADLAAAAATTEPDKTEAKVGGKRKPSDAEASNGDAAEGTPEDAPAEKKQKTGIEATTNGTPRKVGRPKKDKSAPPPVGRTARKTRSQGSAD